MELPTHEKDDNVFAWLFVQKAPPGEALGAEQLVGGRRAIAMRKSHGKSSCFTFGRCVPSE